MMLAQMASPSEEPWSVGHGTLLGEGRHSGQRPYASSKTGDICLQGMKPSERVYTQS